MLLLIFFYVTLFLLMLSAFSPPEWKWGSRASLVLVAVALLLLGLKVFGSPLG